MKYIFCRYAVTKARIVFSLVCSIFAFAQTVWAVDPKWYAVQVSATVQSPPAQVTLSWPGDPNSQSYTVSRKAPNASSWTTIATLSGGATSYTDTSVSAGSSYEYQVASKTLLSYGGYGYVTAGINVPLIDNRGKVLLIVENTYAGDLAAELSRLQQDLVGDGWTVIRRDVSRNDSVVSVKNIIKNEYNADPNNLKTVFLFGRVPVPYSGNLNPDGHPDHKGAWPADVYYADMDGSWTDSSVSSTGAARPQNQNVPGDGKFDQSTLPSNVELQIGRVDLANMTAIKNELGLLEKDLLRQYLNKDHNFRHRKFTLQRRGLICDSFGDLYGEAFASSGWRNFGALFGADKITQVGQLQYMPTLSSQDYLWSYGCGDGSYVSCGGVGRTEDFARTDVKCVFTILFGSYFGDWDAESDILRAPLCSKTYGLVSAWAARPHWFVHPMGLGETIGYCARLSQNNGSGGLYSQQNSGSRGVHVALMGDPTLRLHPVIPVTNLTVNAGTLTWAASTDSSLQGYHVYRATSPNGPFTRLTGSPVAATSYTDTAPAGTNTYMVRAIKLERSSGGTYFNASQGVFFTGISSGGTNDPPPTNVVVIPSIPSGLVASAISISQINLSWQDTSTNEAGFKIERKTGSAGTYAQVADIGPNVTAYSNTGLPAGTQYFYRIRSYNSAGNSSFSTEASATTQNSPPPPPGTVGTPKISPNGAVFPRAAIVALATSTTNATIRYTLDGSVPSSASTVYSGPFTLTGNAVVNAMAFANGTNSAVASATFSKLVIIYPALNTN